MLFWNPDQSQGSPGEKWLKLAYDVKINAISEVLKPVPVLLLLKAGFEFGDWLSQSFQRCTFLAMILWF